MLPEERLSLALPPSTTTPRHARHAACEFLRRNGVGDVDLLLLVVSELVTNAVLHAGGGELALELHDHALRVEVSDRSTVHPVMRTPDAEGHRGLPIVAALCPHWGTIARDTGKTVWCEVDGVR